MNTARGWPAPAKLNLFLHIIGRREDGYHLLQTVFQFLDYGDWLYFKVRKDGAVKRKGEVPGVDPESDLTVRAARLLQSVTKMSKGVTIEVDKRLPMGGGLGGGSSDAATTLVALNALWKTGLSVGELANLGLKLGADVPVFVRGHAAWGEGVGDRLEPVELPEPWYLVVIPPVQVSTAEIFSAPELTRDANPLKIRNFLRGQGENVCEPVVRRRYPEVSEALDWLSGHAPARMSGTGACIFAAFDHQIEAENVLAQIPAGMTGFVARGRNTSPLYDQLEEAKK